MQDWLSHRVQTTPERTALVRAATGETLDFAHLGAMVDDLAGRLVALGVEPGDHLGMVLETRLAAVCTVHAADRLGVVLVPLGDGLTAAELGAQIDAADVTTLVCSEATEARAVDAFDGPICSVDDPEHASVVSLADVTPVEVAPVTWDLDDVRLLLFTSGTTGEPKVVQLTAGNLLWSAVASAFRLGLHRDDRWLVGLPLHHMGGLSPVLRLPLYGMTVVLRESFDAGRTADDIGNFDVTCVSLVPTMLKRMLDLRGTLADTLRVVLLGGAPAPDDLIRRCRDFSIPVHPTYGTTETASQVATATPAEAFDDVGTVGRPLFWTTVAVRDDDGAVDTGDIGEFVVGGPTVSPGYYGNHEATDAAFGPEGFRTGDVGYRDAGGRLFVVGRLDDRIITGGENVYPREIVDVLESQPGVAEAAVVGLPDDEWGELVGALVVATDDLTVEEIDSHCRDRLAGFKLPRVVSFTDELPRTESGTVRREAVRDLLEEGTAIPDAEEATPPVVGDDRPARDDAPADIDHDPAPDGVDSSDADGTDGLITEAEETEDGTEPVGENEDDEAFLVGGQHWGTDEEEDEGGDDPSEGSSDVVTDAHTGASEAGTASQPEPTDADPETPDFVQDALSEGTTDESVPEPTPDRQDEREDRGAAPDETDRTDAVADPDGLDGPTETDDSRADDDDPADETDAEGT
ncbi:o-succinylbenzoate--CoA ligase [Salinigranum salinum]|uniref:o-succinylbenzoate--CoA ligase n=1 Tax=Salinigranum salinum TaxID=1364937 RepID=UPI0012604966|nr:o-succinylbenzoate--CoA ligase [Salinigranum salinum]